MSVLMYVSIIGGIEWTNLVTILIIRQITRDI